MRSIEKYTHLLKKMEQLQLERTEEHRKLKAKDKEEQSEENN